MENSIIGRGESAMSNSIIPKNTVYFNTRPLFEAIKQLIFFKIFPNFGQKGGRGVWPIMEFSIIFYFSKWRLLFGYLLFFTFVKNVNNLERTHHYFRLRMQCWCLTNRQTDTGMSTHAFPSILLAHLEFLLNILIFFRFVQIILC